LILFLRLHNQSCDGNETVGVVEPQPQCDRSLTLAALIAAVTA